MLAGSHRKGEQGVYNRNGETYDHISVGTARLRCANAKRDFLYKDQDVFMTNNDQGNKDIKSKRPAWRFYILWVLANGIGPIIGVFVFFFLAASLGLLGSRLPGQQTNLDSGWKMITEYSLASHCFSAAIIGAMQWLVLRKHITNSRFWFATSAIAMVTGIAASSVMSMFFPLHQMSSLLISWFLFGSVSGVLQWVMLRKQLHYSGLWIFVNVIAGGIAGVFLPDLGITGGSIGWALTGIFTAGILFLLFQRTKRGSVSQSAA